MMNTRQIRTLCGVLIAITILPCYVGAGSRDLKYVVRMTPVLSEGQSEYSVDLVDSSTVFNKEGAIIMVRYMNDDTLNVHYPRLYDGRHVNPYTHSEKDPNKGYILPRFTVFDITVINKTYAKIEFDPAKAILTTDRGDQFLYYDAGREGANPIGNSFSKYYRSETSRSGNELMLNLERMGIVNRTIYHRGKPVFKGDQRMGKLVFDPLPPQAKKATLKINDFVLSFDASGNPVQTVDVECNFDVWQGTVKVEKKKEKPDWY